MLINDAKRDMDHVLGKLKKNMATLNVMNLTHYNYKAIEDPSGVLFLTYTSLAKSKKTKVNLDETYKTRLDQIVAWLGQEFEGVVSDRI